MRSRRSLDHACVDLFCGAGGLTNGLLSAGVNVVAGIDFDEHCRFPYERNNSRQGNPVPFLQEDIASLDPRMVLDILDDAPFSILAGCAPCQPFSNANVKKDRRDKRRTLLGSFLGIIEAAQPDVVISENVPDALRSPEIQGFIEDLSYLGYFVWGDVVDCSLYGLPQKRKRLVLLASRHGRLDLPAPRAGVRTVRDAIGHLPPIRAGACCSRDRFHKSPSLSPLNLERIRASVQGGSVRDLPLRLQPERFRADPSLRFESAYCRMSWDKPAPTLTTKFYTYGTGRFGHPDQDRAISLREGALLQGFPEDYAFVPDNEPITFTNVSRMIGNSVPPTLGRVIGKAVLGHLP